MDHPQPAGPGLPPGFPDLAESGAEARELVADGAVSVNGETDERRGRQLVPGDVVSVSGPGGTRTARVARA